MATAAAPTSSLISLLYRSYPDCISPDATEPNLSDVTPKIYPTYTYSAADKTEIAQWMTKTDALATALGKDDQAAVAEGLASLNTHLSTRTTVLGARPSAADVAVYAVVAPLVEKWTPEERTGEKGYHHIVRHVDFVQNASLFSLRIPEEEKVKIDVDDVKYVLKPVDPKAEKEKKKKEKAAAQAAGAAASGEGRPKEKTITEAATDKVKEVAETVKAAVAGEALPARPKKEKKEKQPKQPKQPAAPATPPSPSVIDLRVGHILRAINHPNADSLYVSTIACGDAEGTENTTVDEATGLVVRTVCSGLNGLVPLEEMQGRKVVTVCNLKPVTMRGIKSCAMVLAASPRVAEGEDSHGGPVELVNPPSNAEAGERVFFEGWEAGEPEKVLNPKKKVWETFQPGFTTTDGLEVGFENAAVPLLQEEASKSLTAAAPAVGKLVTKSGGVCTVKSLKGATVR